MLIRSSDIEQVWSAMLEEKGRSQERNVLIFTSVTEVDSVCAAHMLNVSAPPACDRTPSLHAQRRACEPCPAAAC